MGTAVGDTVGVAPDAQWIGCRNMRRGVGNPGAYVECMEFFFAPYPLDGDPFRNGDPSLAPDVVNNSWGCPPEEGCTELEPIRRASQVLHAGGIMMVVSAGNEGPGCSTVWIPANLDSNVSVGASDRGDQIASFSSRGPATGSLLKPELTAPGIDIVSSIPGGYGSASGTSMAGPHVAGIVALMWSANPNLIGDIERTERILERSASPVQVNALCPVTSGPCACDQQQAGEVPNNVFGYGIVDAPAAVEGALASGN
jgi:subtilisin family serine protease